MALVKTPSKYISLSVLQTILKNNCIDSKGTEYFEDRLIELINYKKQKQAEKLAAKLDAKNKKLLQAWENIDTWRRQIAVLQKKIRKVRKEQGI